MSRAATLIAASLLVSCAVDSAQPVTGLAVSPSISGVPSTPPGSLDASPQPLNVIREVRQWAFAGDPGKAVVSDNFVLYTTERSAIITQRMPGFLEAALANYRTALCELPPPAQPLDIFVMNDRKQWQELTLSILGERGRPIVNGIRRGGFTTQGKSLMFDIGAFDTMAIAAHEAWHAYTQTTFAESLPMWAEEGLATYMEGHRWNGANPQFSGWANIARFDRLRVALKDKQLLPLESVLSSSPNQMIGLHATLPAELNPLAAGIGPNGATDGPILWYAQTWALLHFLNEGEGGKYRSGLHRMIQDAAAGQMRAAVLRRLSDNAGKSRTRLLASAAPVETFRTYFGDDLTLLSGEYERFCASIVRVGARESVTLGLSPLAEP